MDQRNTPRINKTTLTEAKTNINRAQATSKPWNKKHETTITELTNLLKKLQNEPIPYMDYDIAKLKGRSDDYRVRIGSQRIIYTVNWEQKIITVSRIEHRRRAYKK